MPFCDYCQFMKNELCFAFVQQTVAPVMIKTLRGAEEVDAMATLNTCGRSRNPGCPIVVVLKFESHDVLPRTYSAHDRLANIRSK